MSDTNNKEIKITHADVAEALKEQLSLTIGDYDTNGVAVAYAQNERHGMLIAIAIGNPKLNRFEAALMDKSTVKDLAKLLNESADNIGD